MWFLECKKKKKTWKIENLPTNLIKTLSIVIITVGTIIIVSSTILSVLHLWTNFILTTLWGSSLLQIKELRYKEAK